MTTISLSALDIGEKLFHLWESDRLDQFTTGDNLNSQGLNVSAWTKSFYVDAGEEREERERER